MFVSATQIIAFFKTHTIVNPIPIQTVISIRVRAILSEPWPRCRSNNVMACSYTIYTKVYSPALLPVWTLQAVVEYLPKFHFHMHQCVYYESKQCHLILYSQKWLYSTNNTGQKAAYTEKY